MIGTFALETQSIALDPIKGQLIEFADGSWIKPYGNVMNTGDFNLGLNDGSPNGIIRAVSFINGKFPVGYS